MSGHNRVLKLALIGWRARRVGRGLQPLRTPPPSRHRSVPANSREVLRSRWDAPRLTIELDPRSRYTDVTMKSNRRCRRMIPRLISSCITSTTRSTAVLAPIRRPCRVGKPLLARRVSGIRRDDRRRKIPVGAGRCRPVGTRAFAVLSTSTETLFLSALDVSTERFRFDVQFFGNLDPTFQHFGEERRNVPRSPPPRGGFMQPPGGFDSSLLSIDSGLRAERRLATAGEFSSGLPIRRCGNSSAPIAGLHHRF